MKYAKCDYKTRTAVCLHEARFMSRGMKQNLVSVIHDFLYIVEDVTCKPVMIVNRYSVHFTCEL